MAPRMQFEYQLIDRPQDTLAPTTRATAVIWKHYSKDNPCSVSTLFSRLFRETAIHSTIRTSTALVLYEYCDMFNKQNMNTLSDLLKATSIIEEKVNQEIEKLGNLDEDDLDALRRKRYEECKKEALQRRNWLESGHGTYEELSDERAFFDAAKKSERMVCHFYCQSNEQCDIFHQHLRKIAPKYLQTRFTYISADKAQFLTKKLNIRVIPTIAIIMDSITVDYIRGFRDFGDVATFKTEALESRLSRSNVILCLGSNEIAASKSRISKLAGGVYRKKGLRVGTDYGSDDD